MKTKAILLFLILLISQTSTQWVNNYWGNNSADNQIQNSKGLAIATDSENNCFVTGYTVNPVTGCDIIFIKYNENGDTVYSRYYTGTGDGEDRAFGIAVDVYDNIYITGQVYMNGLGFELIVLKYSNDGNLLWAETYGQTDQNLNDAGLAITLDNYNRVYITGYSTGADGYKDIVTLRYNSTGTLSWVNNEDGEGEMDSEGFGIAVDESDNIYVTGYITSSGNSAGKDAVIIKYSPNGTERWIKTYNGTVNLDETAYDIAVDGNRIYVTGYTTAGEGNIDALLIRVSASGNINWVNTYNEGPGITTDRAFGIAVDADGRIYISGETSSMSSGKNYLIIKYNASGSKIWDQIYDGTGSGDDFSNAIDISGNGKVVVTGASTGINQDLDYATVKLNKNNGNINSVSRYTLSGNTNDIAKDVEVSDENKIYVTGYSELIIDNNSSSSAISTIMIKEESEKQETVVNNPGKFSLSQNYPNPFNPSTAINFTIGENSLVKLTVYDLLGRAVDVIVNNELSTGTYSITYSNANLSSGIYFYELIAGSFKDVKKMTIVK